MSTNSQHDSSEEVDLGQLFKAIGNLFNRFLAFISGIFKSLFLAFIWLVFFVKKHFVKLVISGIIGVTFAIITEKFSEPIYKSSIVIKQNYKTGENLYSILERFNGLISEQDSIVLAADLGISSSDANTIREFSMESILDENQKLTLFDSYTKNLDSTLASTLEFSSYINKGREYDYQFQKITVKATAKNIFNKVFQKTIGNVESSQFFKNEQKKDLAELSRKENIIKESLQESDFLQKIYQFVLEKSVEPTNSPQTSVTIDNTKDESVTKEFELYANDVELRRELVRIQREKENLEHIIEIVSNSQNVGVLDKSKDVFGFSLSKKLFYGFLLTSLVFMLLLGIDFFKFLENYKNKA